MPSMKAVEDSRLTQVSAICLALPESSRTDQGSHATFTVRKKTFAYFLNNHHGDGIVSVCSKALPGENNALVAAHPRKFYLPAYIGSRGWIGLRIDRGKIDWNEVRELIASSYLQVAPRRLASRVETTLLGKK
jgi:predicted DNA-binding protein (MmcQ/YjbR family)